MFQSLRYATTTSTTWVIMILFRTKAGSSVQQTKTWLRTIATAVEKRDNKIVVHSGTSTLKHIKRQFFFHPFFFFLLPFISSFWIFLNYLGLPLSFFLYFRPGHIVGVVFGIIAGMVALFIAVFCVVKCIKTNKSRNCKLLIFSSTLKYPILSQYKWKLVLNSKLQLLFQNIGQRPLKIFLFFFLLCTE